MKEEYKEYVEEKYDKKWGKTGLEITKAMKFHLAINGNKKYQNDPEVLAIFEKAKKNFNTKSKSETNNTIEEIIERKLDEKFLQFEKKTRRESSKKHGHAEFKKQFQMAFNDHHQVSRKDLERFIMNHADIVDKRAVQSRIQYLLSHGVLESFAPNVYNIRF